MATVTDLNISEVKLSEEYVGKWGMFINQDVCTGCQACVAACSMENNIAFVGPEDAGYGRTMNWIRIERFWDGEYPEIKMTSRQPMMCQQCGHAPCEPVCPAFATVHSQAQQLNLQVYNRCVGTRYCANNCPYQVRSFNWRDYKRPEPLPNQFNPDVTVRQRGVMEKCTFCIQRIHQAEDKARSEGREVADGEFTTACAQVCPADAITFGRVDNPESLVSQLTKQYEGLKHLPELGTLSNVSYFKGG